jgi:hypothetical protein
MVGKNIKIYKKPVGEHIYAVYATIRGVRERHTHYLTKTEAKRFADMLKDERGKDFGFGSVRVVKHNIRSEKVK